MDNIDSGIPLICHYQAATRKPTFRSNSVPLSFIAAYMCYSLQLYSAIAGYVIGLPVVTSKSNDARKNGCSFWLSACQK